MTMFEPPRLLAVNVEAVATPLEFVVTVEVLMFVELKTPLAPESGAVNVMSTLLAG